MSDATKYGTWALGLALGLVFSWLLFDGALVIILFGVSMGIAFAIALGAGTKAARKGPRPGG